MNNIAHIESVQRTFIKRLPGYMQLSSATMKDLRGNSVLSAL